jgi:hypothetical protein
MCRLAGSCMHDPVETPHAAFPSERRMRRSATTYMYVVVVMPHAA